MNDSTLGIMGMEHWLDTPLHVVVTVVVILAVVFVLTFVLKFGHDLVRYMRMRNM